MLNILVVPPHIVTDPQECQSFVATRLFVETERLPDKRHLCNSDFGVIGVLGNEYSQFQSVRNAMRKFAFPKRQDADNGTCQDAYKGVYRSFDVSLPIGET
jgi:hypothetical protein